MPILTRPLKICSEYDHAYLIYNLRIVYRNPCFVDKYTIIKNILPSYYYSMNNEYEIVLYGHH